MPAHPSPARQHDDEVVRRIRSGETYPQVMSALGLSRSQVKRALQLRNAFVGREEGARRRIRNLEAIRSDPALEQRRVEALRRARTVWPDCPPEARERYAALRSYYSAAEARALTERELGL